MKQFKSTPQFFGKSAIAAAVLATTVATPAFAQLEEVLVTAQKRSQTVQDVPSSVTAMSEEMLEKSNTRNFSDLSKITSGLEITGGSDGFGMVIRIRGVGTNSFAPAIRPAVGIFMNEVPLASPEAAYNNMADIERVEVLKGPQSTLFGKEVSSGAISLFTKRPSTEGIDGYIEGNFGNLGLQEFRLGGNLPMGDMFAIRASIYSNQRDGYIDNITLDDDMGEIDAEGVRARLGWEPTDNFEAILSYENHQNDVYGTTSSTQQYGDLYTQWEAIEEGITDPADSLLNVLDPYDRKTDQAAFTVRESETTVWSLNMTWDINDQWSMTSVTSDQEFDALTVGHDGSGKVHSANAGERVQDTASTSIGPYKLQDFNGQSQPQTEGITQELRFTFEGDKLSTIIGGFYAETEINSNVNFSQMLGYLAPGFPPLYFGGFSDLHDDVEEWSVFTHNIYSINEGLDFTFGVRYSYVEKESDKVQVNGQGPLGYLNSDIVPVDVWYPDPGAPTQKNDWDEITGTLKLTYWINDEMSMYGGWDRGFKAGGHDVCKGSRDGLTVSCPEPFESEVADNFEIGLKGRFLDNTLVWNSAVFYQQFEDYQVNIADEVGIGNHIQNAASAIIQGFETEVQWMTGAHLIIDGNLSYIDARWDDYEDAGCTRPQWQRERCTIEEGATSPTQDLSGKRLNYTSPWSANLNATWSDQFDNGINWYIRGEIAFKDDRFFFPDLDPDLQDSSYTLFNASLGFTGEAGNWDVILWGKNLLDEEYLATGAQNRDSNFISPPVPFEGYRVNAGEEPTYGITLKYRMGNF
jgi:iron complex outermembrane receptor protein